MPEVFSTHITIARPSDNYPGGVIEVGNYTVEGDTVTLTDADGKPVMSGRLALGYTAKTGPNEQPQQAANRLLWRFYRATKSGSDFNRPIVYPKSYVV